MSEITDNKVDVVQVYDAGGSQAKESGDLQSVESLKINGSMAGRISGTFLKNIALPKDKTLFDDLPEEERGDFFPKENRIHEGRKFEILYKDDEEKKERIPYYIEKDEKGENKVTYVDKEGKNILLSNRQAKMVYVLSYSITQHLEDEDIANHIESIEKRDKNGKPIAKNFDIQRTIDTRELALLFCKSARESDIAEAYKTLKELKEIKQVQRLFYKDRDGKESTYTYKVPLILLGAEGWIKTAEPTDNNNQSKGKRGAKRKQIFEDGFLAKIDVRFSNLFFQKVTSNFAYLSPKLFDVWGKRGNGTETELFPILLSELGAKFPGHYIAARRAADEVWKDNSIPKKDKGKIVAQRQKKELTYAIWTETIKSKVTTNYSGTRKMKIQFFKHLEQVIKVLVEVGLITNETKVDKAHKDPQKGYKVSFVFNYNYTNFKGLEEPKE